MVEKFEAFEDFFILFRARFEGGCEKYRPDSFVDDALHSCEFGLYDFVFHRDALPTVMPELSDAQFNIGQAFLHCAIFL